MFGLRLLLLIVVYMMIDACLTACHDTNQCFWHHFLPAASRDSRTAEELLTDQAEELTAEELLTNEAITAVELYLRSFAPSHLRTFAPSHLRTFAHLPKS